MKWSPIVVAPVLVAMSTVSALADQTELLFIGNTSVNNSEFYMLSVRHALSGDLSDGLRLRFDASVATYDTEYNAVSGEGTVKTGRALVSYVTPISDSTFVTLTGGVSYGARTVRPVTLNSPADTEAYGAFASIELYNSSLNGNDLHLLAEYDTAFETFYAGSTYEFSFGGFKAGPTLNYLSEGDYTRNAAGMSVSFDLSNSVEIKSTLAWAEAQIGAAAATDVSYFELQLRTTF